MIIATTTRSDLLAQMHALAFEVHWDAKAFADLLQSPGVFALADVDFRGFVLIRPVADQAEVLTLAVKPDARRRGLGRQLLDQAMQRAIEQGAESLFLEVAADNDAAIALYAALGFETIGRRAGYYAQIHGPAADALVLKRQLRPTA